MHKYLFIMGVSVLLFPVGLSAAPPSFDLPSLQEKAREGDATAQFNLGSLYAKGQRVTQNYDVRNG